jgi:hypothetical protein
MREAPQILSDLGVGSGTEAKYSGMQQMVALARQNRPDVWNKFFGQILLCLLEGIGHTGAEHSLHPNQMSPTNASPISTASGGSAESPIKHLYVRALKEARHPN